MYSLARFKFRNAWNQLRDQGRLAPHQAKGLGVGDLDELEKMARAEAENEAPPALRKAITELAEAEDLVATRRAKLETESANEGRIKSICEDIDRREAQLAELQDWLASLDAIKLQAERTVLDGLQNPLDLALQQSSRNGRALLLDHDINRRLLPRAIAEQKLEIDKQRKALESLAS